MRLLLVEDDEMLGDALASALRLSNYAVDLVDSGSGADQLLNREAYDLVILDVGLPGMDGFEVLRKLRKRENHIPVLILTARDELEARVHGLDIGADDYLVKPVALIELEARIRALIRRLQPRRAQLAYGPLVLDQVSRRAWLTERPLELTAREWAILEYLMMREGRIVSKEQLLETLCDLDRSISLNAIEVYVSRLRAKLEADGVKIQTVRGFGYLLEERA
ncbi:MAG: response regulator transcription factor [Gammaproteobacteria bacterium]|nr:response regulator transcription factor [Gammaproteobacteria bacterium]